jgi:YegS/Rv2252/BmrU family lipid kinase
VNPVAGAGGARDAGWRRAAEARAVLGAAGVDADVRVSERPGHLVELAREMAASGVDRVFAWGGDGTVHEVGRALAFGRVPLAIVPAGSGNGLARALGIPRRAPDALRRGITAAPRRIDLGQIADRLFLNVAGLGFDAVVAHAFGRYGRGLRGYVRLVAGELLRYAGQRCTVACDGRLRDTRVFLLAFANGPQWGNGARIAPDARLDDGLLDVVTAESGPLWRVALQVPRLFTGSIAHARGVTIDRAAHVEVESDLPLVLHADGEAMPSPGARVTVRVHARALGICA